MPETSQERTEEATPKRRREARRKGTVAKSVDLTSALVVMGLLIVLPTAIGILGSGFMSVMRKGLREIPNSPDFRDLSGHIWIVMQPAMAGLALIVLTAMTVGVAANVGQVGFVLSGEVLTPSFAKLNPIEGLKRLFSKRSLFEGGKATFKSAVFFFLTWSVISSNWDRLFGMAYLPPAGALSSIGDLIRAIAVKVVMAWLALAAIDYFFQRKQVNQQLKMTKEEVKQEMKDAETSQEVKIAIHKRRRQLTKQRLAEAIRKASVIVTNPTHYAVAIAYEQGKDHAPIVVAKGQDLIAARIRELAAEYKVPIVPNPPLARTLYKKCEIGDHVPRELFQAVAEVLAFVYRTLNKIRASV